MNKEHYVIFLSPAQARFFAELLGFSAEDIEKAELNKDGRIKGMYFLTKNLPSSTKNKRNE